MIDLESFKRQIGLFNGGNRNARNPRNAPQVRKINSDLGKLETKLIAITLNLILLISGIEINPGPISKSVDSASKDITTTAEIVKELINNQEFKEVFKGLIRGSMKSEIPTLLEPVLTKIDNFETMSKSMTTEIKEMNIFRKKISSDNFQLQAQVGKLKSKIVELEDRSRRNNLIFHGIAQNCNENNQEIKTMNSFLKSTVN